MSRSRDPDQNDQGHAGRPHCARNVYACHYDGVRGDAERAHGHRQVRHQRGSRVDTNWGNDIYRVWRASADGPFAVVGDVTGPVSETPAWRPVDLSLARHGRRERS